MEAKGSYRLRLLYLAKVLMENTDEDHALEISQINSLLAEYGITANRKTLYMDFEDLRAFGMELRAPDELLQLMRDHFRIASL